MNVSKLARYFSVAISLAGWTAAFAAASADTRCTRLPDEKAKLSNDMLGLIRTDDQGHLIASIWSRLGYDIKLVAAHLEGDIARLIVQNPYQENSSKSCPAGMAQEIQFRLPDPEGARETRLQAEILKANAEISPGVNARISSAVDCGGVLSGEYQAARERGVFHTTRVVDDKRINVSLMTQYSGATYLVPRATLSGNVLEVGYAEKTSKGVAPACVFSERINFFVSGIDARNTQVKLRTGNWSLDDLILPAGLLALSFVLVVWQRRRLKALRGGD